MVYTTEHLNVVGWIRQIRPELRRARREAGQRNAVRLLYIDATRPGLFLARWWCRRNGIILEQLSFQLVEVRDDQGALLRLRIPYRDLFEIQKDIVLHPDLQRFLSTESCEALRFFITKQSVTMADVPEESVWRALLIIQVCFWKLQEKGASRNGTLFLRRRPWHDIIVGYGARYGITVRAASAGAEMRQWMRRVFSPRTLERFRTLRSSLYNMKLTRRAWKWKRYPRKTTIPRIGVEHSGHFILDSQQNYSDFFFLQQSNLKASDVHLLFTSPADPLDYKKLATLRKHDMGAIALYPGASVVPAVPIFIPSTRTVVPHSYTRTFRTAHTIEGKWLKRQVDYFETLRAYWYHVFSSENVKAYITWYRYDAKHVAITAAMRDAGGVTALYQRALQPDSSPEIAVYADCMFGYAPSDATVEQQSGSRIRYHVAVGYVHDYVFPHCRKEAQRVRELLHTHGARCIVAYFDENSIDDARWHTGHEFMRQNYAFLLDKVIAQPWLGVVLKPKYPSNLRKRLGPVDALLTSALATGRVHLFEAGPLHSSYPPAVAALASDVAIHGHLCAGSAGFESALVGVPTVLLDREGWPLSSLYRLGVGKVVFRNWEELWEAFEYHRRCPGGMPGFGDWSSIIQEYDPFRDGKAAERVGTYLEWVLSGLREGKDRDIVLADAAERYAHQWGASMVREIT